MLITHNSIEAYSKNRKPHSAINKLPKVLYNIGIIVGLAGPTKPYLLAVVFFVVHLVYCQNSCILALLKSLYKILIYSFARAIWLL